MLNALTNPKLGINDALSMMWGHRNFLHTNTGDTNDSKTEHFVLNTKNVLSNNRHFTNETMAEGQPNADATTEGQSLLIIGCCYNYMATGKQEYLDDAIKYWDAYLNYFYADKWDEDGGSTGHNPIPNPPGTWVSNWIINGKEPRPSNFPIDWDFPTHGGTKGAKFTFDANLETQVPHGAPYFGEYMDKATFAFEGGLAWDSIVATVYGTKMSTDANGNQVEDIDWSTDGQKRGKQFDVDWVIDRTGRKISEPDGYPEWVDPNVPDDQKVAKIYPQSDIGKIKLKPTYKAWRKIGTDPKGKTIWESYQDNTPAGEHKLNFATAVPKDKGGYELPRNKPWHNRPVNVPVGYNRGTGHYTNLQQLGNSSDSEQWFGDASYLLSKLTGDDKYFQAYQCVIFNTDAYSDIDAVDKFFRVSLNSTNPWTDGISYDYHYPNVWQDPRVVGPDGKPNGPKIPVPDGITARDDAGYITVAPAKYTIRNTLEQQAVWFKINQDSQISTEVGGNTNLGEALDVNIVVDLSTDKNADDEQMTRWKAYVPTDSSGSLGVFDIPLNNFVQARKANGEDFLMIDSTAITNYGGLDDPKMTYDTAILNTRPGSVPVSVFPELLDADNPGEEGIVIGVNWFMDEDPNTGEIPLVDTTYITYKLDAPVGLWLSHEDSDGWHWHWLLEPTGGKWTKKPLSAGNIIFNNWQPNHAIPPFRVLKPGSHNTWITEPATNWWGPENAYKYPTGLPPTRPTSMGCSQRTVTRGDVPASRQRAEIGFYCWNDVPERYSDSHYAGRDTYLMLYQLNVGIPSQLTSAEYITHKIIDKEEIRDPNTGSVISPEEFHFEYELKEPQKEVTYTYKVGDCTVKGYRPGNLKYTPGVIPFSNIYSDGGIDTFDGWHGMPYPGYQYPLIWLDQSQGGFYERFMNMTDFLYDSQQEYYRRYGELGPGMSAFVWNRWDNYKYGTPDSWTEYHWGGDHAWSGYQPRAFYGAARAAYEWVLQYGQQNLIDTAPKLVTYTENWIKWLYRFMTEAEKKFGRPISPTEWYFPKQASEIAGHKYYTADGISRPNPDDFTSHMCGLWLAGCCTAWLAGSDLPELPYCIEMLASELNYNYLVSGVPNRTINGVLTNHAMDGGWSYAPKFDSGFGKDCKGVFFGFHSGEVLRGLGLYVLYKTLNQGDDIYDFSTGGTP